MLFQCWKLFFQYQVQVFMFAFIPTVLKIVKIPQILNTYKVKLLQQASKSGVWEQGS